MELGLGQTLAAAWRVVIQRGGSDWLIVAATWLVILLATTFLSAAVIYADAVAHGGLQRVLSSAPATDVNLEIATRAVPDEAERTDAAVTAAAARALGPAAGEIARHARSESFALPDQDPDRVTGLVVFDAYPEIDRHAELLEGSWPEAGAEPMQAVVSEAAGEPLGVAVGDRLEVQSRLRESLTASVQIVGIFRVADPESPYWWGDELTLRGVDEGVSFTTNGPLVVDREDLLERAIATSAFLEWRVLPAFDRLTVDASGPVRRAVARLEASLDAAIDGRQSISVETRLDAILADAERSLLVSRTGVLLLTVQLALLAGYGLILVAGLLVDQRRAEMALLRSRGAGTLHVGALAMVEGIGLAVPAAVAGPPLAAAMLELLNVAGPLADVGLGLDLAVSQGAFVVSAIAAGACVVALVVPALVSARALASVRRGIGRQALTTVTQRGGVDVALFAVAVIGLWQLRQYGAPITRSLRGDLGLDPILVAAPAIGVLAGALLALRLLPLAASGIERLVSRTPGLVGPLGSRQLARRPLRYTRSALLLMLASALGVFAASYTGTWMQSQRDQADYQVGSDVRVERSRFGSLPGWAHGAAYEELDGVERAVPARLERLTMRGTSATMQLLALDAAHADGLVAVRADLADGDLARLMTRLEAGRPDTSGVLRLDPEARRLAVTIDMRLGEPGNPASEGFMAEWRGGALSVVLRDADGLIQRLGPRPLTYGGGEQRVEVALGGVSPDGAELRLRHPVEVLALELALTPPPEMSAAGSVELIAVEVSSEVEGGADAGSAWEPLAVDPGGGEWRWLRSQDFAEPRPVATEPGVPRRVLIDEERPNLSGIDDVVMLRAAALDASAAPLPAIVNARFLELAGATVGEQAELPRLSGRGDAIEVVGTVRGYPTLDAAAPLVIVDAPSLVLDAYLDGRRALEATEWWLGVGPGKGEMVAEQLAQPPFAGSVVTARASRAQALLNDPVALGLVGALLLGALAAAGFAIVGFVVSSSVAARERLSEFALLRAMGLSTRQLSGWLSLENAFLLASGLVGGIALGLLLAWLVLPFVTLTQEASAAMPPAHVVLPWELVAILPVVGLALLLLSIWLMGGFLRRVELAGTLRAGDE